MIKIKHKRHLSKVSRFNLTHHLCSTINSNSGHQTSTQTNSFHTRLYSNFYAKLSVTGKSMLKSMDAPFVDNCLRNKSCTRNFRIKVANELSKKYANQRAGYDKIIINDIIKNRSTHITSVFKEYLVFDEPIEFLKRYYEIYECQHKVVKLAEFHNSYFKVFPNFINIPERYYMYKNIERKQRVIDDKQYRILENRQKLRQKSKSFSEMFDESYAKHISLFRENFEKEEIKNDVHKINRLYLPKRPSLSHDYGNASELSSKLISQNNSIQNILSKVNTSDIFMNNDKFEISDDQS